MGLSSLPTPSEGILSVLAQTALSISFFKSIVGSILHVIGIVILSSSSSHFQADSVEISADYLDFHLGHSETFIEEFRRRVPAIRFDKACNNQQHELNCSVCLTQFEPESEINLLSCGHIFHKLCLEKWLDYWNITCPMCRTPLMHQEERTSFG